MKTDEKQLEKCKSCGGSGLQKSGKSEKEGKEEVLERASGGYGRDQMSSTTGSPGGSGTVTPVPVVKAKKGKDMGAPGAKKIQLASPDKKGSQGPTMKSESMGKAAPLPSLTNYQSLATNPTASPKGPATPANPANNKPKLPTGHATATQANEEIKGFQSLVKPQTFKSPITKKVHAVAPKTGEGTFQDS